MMFFIVLLQHFACVRAIQTSKVDLISRRYHIMAVSMFKNWSRRFYSYYIIKFVGFMLIYYTINLDIVSSFAIGCFSSSYCSTLFV